MPVIYRVDFDPTDPAAVILGVFDNALINSGGAKFHPLKEPFSILYGPGMSPYVNIVDREEISNYGLWTGGSKRIKRCDQAIPGSTGPIFVGQECDLTAGRVSLGFSRFDFPPAVAHFPFRKRAVDTRFLELVY